jgi:hypothetical protein
VGGHDWFVRLGHRRVGEVKSWRRLAIDPRGIAHKRDQVIKSVTGYNTVSK